MVIRFVKKTSAIALICICIIGCNSNKEEKPADLIPLQPVSGSDTAPDSTTIKLATGGIEDIWVLDSINNKPMNPADYSKGTPYIEFALKEKKFIGHTGCNNMTGRMNITDNKITIDSFIVSRETCKNKAFEKPFVNTMRSKDLTYTIKDYKLYLKSGVGSTYIFRRIRRN